MRTKVRLPKPEAPAMQDSRPPRIIDWQPEHLQAQAPRKFTAAELAGRLLKDPASSDHLNKRAAQNSGPQALKKPAGALRGEINPLALQKRDGRIVARTKSPSGSTRTPAAARMLRLPPHPAGTDSPTPSPTPPAATRHGRQQPLETAGVSLGAVPGILTHGWELPPCRAPIGGRQSAINQERN